jgi:hypothetical protein
MRNLYLTQYETFGVVNIQTGSERIEIDVAGERTDYLSLADAAELGEFLVAWCKRFGKSGE